MRLLLDTHAIIWLSYEASRVPSRLRQKLSEADELYVSVVSGWEYEQKRLRHGPGLPEPFAALVEALELTPLDLAFACHAFSASLPRLHADPFDRMLVAQALHHQLTLVTNDRMIRRYAVEILW